MLVTLYRVFPEVVILRVDIQYVEIICETKHVNVNVDKLRRKCEDSINRRRKISTITMVTANIQPKCFIRNVIVVQNISVDFPFFFVLRRSFSVWCLGIGQVTLTKYIHTRFNLLRSNVTEATRALATYQ